MSTRRHTIWGDPCTGEGCWGCATGLGFATWAHGAWQALAVTLAEPLRKALADHLDQCGCAERTGFLHCPEAMRLFLLLPEGDRVLLAGGGW